MRLLLATNHLRDRGGSETYLLSVARELERLGHDVVLLAGDPPPDGSPLAREEGLRYAAHVDDVGPAPDRVLVQDGIVSGLLAAAFPDVPQVLVAHSVLHGFQLPPVLPEAVAAVVALNDRVAGRVRATAGRAPVVRLRQPVDLQRFRPGAALAAAPRRVLLFGNHQDEARWGPLRRTCADRGVEVVALGGAAGTTDRPEDVMREVDVVVGYGRCVVEAMATGRCAYVYDRFGADGWVTAATWEALESTGFNGKAGGAPPGPDDLAAALDAYDPAHGLQGQDLAYRHHDVRDHAASLVELLEGASPRGTTDPALAVEVARLWREQWRWERQVVGAVQALEALRGERDALRRELQEAQARAAALEAERAAAEQRAQQQEAELAAVLASRRWRLASGVADRVRGQRGEGRSKAPDSDT